MEIYPAIDLINGECVRLFQGDYSKKTVFSSKPADQAAAWQNAGAPLIHLVDLDGAKSGAVTNADAIASICSRVSIPCELGGGIRSIADAERVFKLGIARVILGTVVCDHPELAKDFLDAFGADRIVVGIDARDGKVATRGWLNTSDRDAVELGKTLAAAGVKRFIVTDIATDGAMKGPNCAFMRKFCLAIPQAKVVASGGVTCPQNVTDLCNEKLDNLEGVIVGRALYDGNTTYQMLANATGN